MGLNLCGRLDNLSTDYLALTGMLIRNCLGGIYVATGLVPGDEALAAAGHEPKQPQACHHEPSVGGGRHCADRHQ